MSRKIIGAAFAGLVTVCAGLHISPAAAQSQTIASVYSALDLDKCRHTKGKQEEDYGEWHCNGYGGIAVHVSAGDQRTYVSYGANAKKELAAKQT
ncbi:MAG: hypothetical protein ABI830_13885, partial [Pseudolabrys sp.]